MVGREFGEALRPVMERTGHSMRQLATRLGWDHPKLSDLVNGKGGSSEAELMFLLGVCGATVEERDHLLALFNETRERGLLQFSAVPEQVRTLIAHEKQATAITVWSTLVVPGLLQIESYARAAAIASPYVAPKDVEALVAARMRRREIFDGTCRFNFFMYEPVLRSDVGSPEIMSDQLHDLLRMRVRPFITLRVVPAGAHAVGDFRVMKFEKFGPVVYLESVNSGLFLDDKASVALYEKFLAELGRVALSAEESRELITSIVS
ncbi:transcriptional regulator [Lentzea sp. NBRC 105346]|nr:transcriptional regulator [Lentzea sp. NBRC 105346]